MLICNIHNKGVTFMIDIIVLTSDIYSVRNLFKAFLERQMSKDKLSLLLCLQ